MVHNARGGTKAPITSRRIAISMMMTNSGGGVTPLSYGDGVDGAPSDGCFIDHHHGALMPLRGAVRPVTVIPVIP